MSAYNRSVNPRIAIPASPPPQRRLSPRDLVAIIVTLETRRGDLRATGQPTNDLDRELFSARGRLIHREFDVPPAEAGR